MHYGVDALKQFMYCLCSLQQQIIHSLQKVGLLQDEHSILVVYYDKDGYMMIMTVIQVEIKCPRN